MSYYKPEDDSLFDEAYRRWNAGGKITLASYTTEDLDHFNDRCIALRDAGYAQDVTLYRFSKEVQETIWPRAVDKDLKFEDLQNVCAHNRNDGTNDQDRELDHRVNEGYDISLRWNPKTNETYVRVVDPQGNESVIPAPPDEVKEVFNHPYAYA